MRSGHTRAGREGRVRQAGHTIVAVDWRTATSNSTQRKCVKAVVCTPARTLAWADQPSAVNRLRIARVVTEGTIVGAVGAVSFAIVHAMLIVPIWSRIPAGMVQAERRRVLALCPWAGLVDQVGLLCVP